MISKVLATGTICVMLLIPLTAHATDILKTLIPGSYIAGTDCDGLGGAGDMDFDGKNFSGHYMICRTVAGPFKSGKIISKCIEAQGKDYQHLENTDIAKNPNAETVKQTLKITTPKQFYLDKQKYTFCVAD